MPEQELTEQFLREVAAAIDSSAKTIFGKRVGFSLFVYPQEEGEKANYISNCEKEETVKALRHALMRIETDMVDPPFDSDKINPTKN